MGVDMKYIVVNIGPGEVYTTSKGCELSKEEVPDGIGFFLDERVPLENIKVYKLGDEQEIKVGI